MMMLFSEIGLPEIVSTVLGGGTIAAIGYAVVNVMKSRREGKDADRKGAKEDRTDTIDEWNKLLEYMKAENNRKDRIVADQSSELAGLKVHAARAESQIQYLMRWCKDKGMPVELWNIDTGSTATPPIPLPLPSDGGK